MEKFSYEFNTGVELTIQHGEDGYTVHFNGGGYAPKMGTYTSFKKLLEDIAPLVQGNSDTRTEVEMVAMQLDMSFTTELEEEDIEDILLSD